MKIIHFKEIQFIQILDAQKQVDFSNIEKNEIFGFFQYLRYVV